MIRLGRGLAIVAAAAAVVALVPPVAGAQPPPDDAQQRQAASEAYDRGSAAYLARDYAAAAQWFETAHRLAPAAASLVQAVRSHERAGNDLRAATLALRLSALYPDDRTAERTWQRILTAATRRYVRVEVRCEDCTVDLDGTLLDHPRFFVEPDQDHRVSAVFPTGTVVRSVNGEAGETIEVDAERPPPSAGGPDHDDPPSPDGNEPDRLPSDGQPRTGGPSGAVDDDRGIGVLPRPVAISAMAATVGVAAVLIWSGVDTLSGVDAYEDMPTAERLDNGQDRERRTNILIGVTAGMAAVTVALSIFTDWSGPDDDEEAPVRAAAAPVRGGAAAVLQGRF